jgi:nicotinamide-nucleotide amidase
MPLRTAEVLAVGSELLTRFRQDTNSLFLAGRLDEAGIDLRWKTVVGDRRTDLVAAVQHARSRVDLVVTTGGLGPTADDLTREAVAEVLALPLEEDPAIMSAIRARFETRRIPMPDLNRRQALVPRGATVLPNPRGTAPGLWIESGGTIVVLLPGPPRELEPMFDDHVAPRLRARSGGRQVRRRVIKTTGRSESAIDEVAEPVYSKWTGPVPVPIDTTILAAPGLIELHLSARGDDVAALDRALDDGVRRLADVLGSAVVSIDGRSLEAVVGDALRARAYRIAVAESCTGGLLLGRLTEVPGSSAWVNGGVVAYADAVKIDQLGVDAQLLHAHGAVSEPVAQAMAHGVRARLQAQVGVAITGIAGPDGGTSLKPVGTVVVAVVTAGADVVRTFLFPGDRRMVRLQSVNAALNMVRTALG